jgi:hypothetical protein
MFVKPQITSTPHLVTPMVDIAGQACSVGYGPCPSGFGSCSPWSNGVCVDAPGPGPGPGIVTVAVVGAIMGGVVIIAK